MDLTQQEATGARNVTSKLKSLPNGLDQIGRKAASAALKMDSALEVARNWYKASESVATVDPVVTDRFAFSRYWSDDNADNFSRAAQAMRDFTEAVAVYNNLNEAALAVIEATVPTEAQDDARADYLAAVQERVALVRERGF